MADWFLAHGWLIERDGHWILPDAGVGACSAALGIPLSLPRSTSRPTARPCPDWTERRPHLAGRLGAALLTGMLDAAWLSRRTSDRALRLTPTGRTALSRLGLTDPALPPPSLPPSTAMGGRSDPSAEARESVSTGMPKWVGEWRHIPTPRVGSASSEVAIGERPCDWPRGHAAADRAQL
jgi:hypothetical protein